MEHAIQYRPTKYFERGKEATFSIKTHKCFPVPSQLIYFWKLNGKEISRKPIFKHSFIRSGRYSFNNVTVCLSELILRRCFSYIGMYRVVVYSWINMIFN